MRINVLVLAASLLLIANCSAGIPQSSSTATSSAQAATLLAQSAKALTGATVVNDVTLTGTVEWIAGSDDETGTVTYKGLSGAYRLDMAFRNGTRSEIVSPNNGVPSGNWVGLDGVFHAIVEHNLMAEAGWFPTFTLASLISSSNSIITYIGQETRNGSSVIHIRVGQQFPYLSGDAATLVQHLSQVEIYLDPSTYLPVFYTFDSHPDNNATLDLPTEVRYSDYSNINGAQIPLHVQKFMNGSLIIDIHFQNSFLNTGLSISQISAQ
jgi:hypothetical protein